MISYEGYFKINPKLNDYDKYYLLNFNKTIHLKRNVSYLRDTYKGRNGYNGIYGIYGEFFVNFVVDINGKDLDNETFSDFIKHNDSIIDHEKSPPTQPNKYCPWVPNSNGDKLFFKPLDKIIITNKNENKEYIESFQWMNWIVNNIIKNKYKVNGYFEIINKKENYHKTLKINNNKFTLESNYLTSVKDDNDILNEIIILTKNKELEWIKTKSNFYKSKININKNFIIILLLINKKLNIYIKKNNKTQIYKKINNVNNVLILKNIINYDYGK